MKVIKHQIKSTFGIEAPDHLTIDGFEAEGNPHVPEKDLNYLFRIEVLRDLLAWYQAGGKDGLYLVGPTGSGKSSVVLQAAARLNIPVIVVNGHPRMELPELLGQPVLMNGTMQWCDGPLTTAYRNGYWFLLDEIDILDPAAAVGLNAVAERRPLTIPEKGGEVVSPAPGFKFIVTANTAGSGDRSGIYQGTMRLNGAFLDRFFMVEVGYPDPKLEKDILSKTIPHLPEVVRDRMVEMANEIRSSFKDGSIEVTFSTRTLIRWGSFAAFFKPLVANGIDPIVHALDRALGFRAEDETRQMLVEICDRHFGGKTA